MRYDDVMTISTPEGVDIDLLLAGAASRFVSAIVDILIQIVLLGCVALVLGLIAGPGLGRGGGVAVLLWAIVSFLVVTLYDVFFEVLNSGRTPGKKMNGLRVVRVGGAPVTFLTSLVRNSLRIVDFVPSAYLLGATVILATRTNQRIGDVVAGTLVVRELPAKQPEARKAWPLFYDEQRPPGTLDTSRITAEELAAVRQFLERRWSIDGHARSELASLMAERLRPKLAGASPELRGERLLEAIAAAKGARS